MAKKGDWVRIHKVVLPAAERTAKIPDDTMLLQMSVMLMLWKLSSRQPKSKVR